MKKMLIVDHTKCTGCRLCEVVCSANKIGTVNPNRARVAVVKWEQSCVAIPMLCQQCESAPCMAVCPVKALNMDESIGRVTVNYDLCIGCRFCVAVCPFGAMDIDSVTGKVIKCDLCDGEPMCAKFCETGALQYVDVGTANREKRRLAADVLSDLIRKSGDKTSVS